MMPTPKPSSLLDMRQLTRRQLLHCYARREPCGQHAHAVTADLPVGCGVGCILGVIHHSLDSTSEELEGWAEAPLLQIGHHKARTNGHHAPAQHNTYSSLDSFPSYIVRAGCLHFYAFLPILCVLVVYISLHSLCVLLVYSTAQHITATQSQIQQSQPIALIKCGTDEPKVTLVCLARQAPLMPCTNAVRRPDKNIPAGSNSAAAGLKAA